MTVLQRLLLEAGTAIIVVLAAYALIPVWLIIVNGDKLAPKKKEEEE